MPVCVTRVVLVLFDREMEFKAKLGDSSGEISPVGAECVTMNKVWLSLPTARSGPERDNLLMDGMESPLGGRYFVAHGTLRPGVE